MSKFKTYLESRKVSFFDIIIDDGSHILSNIMKKLVFFFKYLIPGGIYVIEDYKHPNYFTFLHDVKNHIFIDKVLFYLWKKKLFKSNILSKNEINYLINKVKNIFIHKGSCIEKKKNISDIAFIYKNKFDS